MILFVILKKKLKFSLMGCEKASIQRVWYEWQGIHSCKTLKFN